MKYKFVAYIRMPSSLVIDYRYCQNTYVQVHSLCLRSVVEKKKTSFHHGRFHHVQVLHCIININTSDCRPSICIIAWVKSTSLIQFNHPHKEPGTSRQRLFKMQDNLLFSTSYYCPDCSVLFMHSLFFPFCGKLGLESCTIPQDFNRRDVHACICITIRPCSTFFWKHGDFRSW